MEKSTALCVLSPGQSAIVSDIRTSGEERRRLRELGLTNGACVKCVLRRGNISAYLIKGTVIALRACDSRSVCVTPLSGEQLCAERSCSVWL